MQPGKPPSFRDLVESCRDAARDRVRQEIRRTVREQERKGYYPYEGTWLSREEIAAFQDAMRRKGRGMFVEWVALVVLVAGFDLLFALVLLSL